MSSAAAKAAEKRTEEVREIRKKEANKTCMDCGERVSDEMDRSRSHKHAWLLRARGSGRAAFLRCAAVLEDRTVILFLICCMFVLSLFPQIALLHHSAPPRPLLCSSSPP